MTTPRQNASRQRNARSSPRRSAALGAAVVVGMLASGPAGAQTPAPINVGFLWHMHQPVYYPGENIVQTQSNNRYSFSLYDVHNQRFGPYTTWPRNAVQKGLHLPNLGSQVSFSGSLIENLNNLRNANVNGGMWNGWNGAYQQAKGWTTQRGNTRMDMIGFTYHHALGPLLDTRDLRMQIRMHRIATQNTFGGAYSKGFFPAETAFSSRMIPALVAEGFEWTLFDSIHAERAMKTYPHSNASGMFAPNKADQVNAAPSAWVQLNNLWAPTKVAAPDGYRPAHVQYVDPNSGQVQKIVGVPAARYEGNEDGRGGYGAFLYQTVMDQYRQYNTDPNRPMFVVLHHDGDNYGGGSEAYYGTNFQNMVNWATGNANYNVSTIQDYLGRFPVPQNAVIHVENGSWAGADSGDPEFKKWLGDPNASNWSPDRNSWAVLTAAKNRVYTAEDLLGAANPQNVISNTGTAAERGWHYLTQAMASDHWYWDGTEIWDSNVTRGSNLAVQQVNPALTPSAVASESTPPSVFVPQRDSYNPGEFEFGTNRESSDFKVWTFAYDVSGIQSINLKYRIDLDGENPLGSTHNETYAGGSEVGNWISLPMTVRQLTSPGNILAPLVRADEYSALIAGITNKLLDYYVEAVDGRGNITRTDIQHVWVGGASGGGGGGLDFTMDGQLDANTTLGSSNAGLSLHYSRKGGKLYVATNAAGGGNDRFIFVARNPGALGPAQWAKAGQVAGWDAFLGNEADNNWSGWFDAAAGATAQAAVGGGTLEGTLDLVAEFGFVPSAIYLAGASYQTANGGALVAQVPSAVAANGNLEANEFLRIDLGQGYNGAGANANWNTIANWFDGAIPNAAGAHAQFLASGVGTATTVGVNVPVTVGQVTLDTTSPVTLAGTGPLTVDVAAGSGTIAVLRGQHQLSTAVIINDPVTVNVTSGTTLAVGGTLTVANGSTLMTTGGGTITIAAAVNATPGATLRVNGASVSTTADLNGLAVQVDAGTARFDAGQRVAALAVAGGASAQLVDAVTTRVMRTGALASAGTFDIADNALVVDYAGASPIAAIRLDVADGYNGGNWLGEGITSFNAALNAGRAVGFGEAGALGITTFFGETADATTVLVRLTVVGDATLDGRTDIADFARLAASFNVVGTAWHDGDFNYSGATDIADFAALAARFNQSVASDLPRTPIPEPGSIGLLAATTAGLLPRRRRRAAAR